MTTGVLLALCALCVLGLSQDLPDSKEDLIEDMLLEEELLFHQHGQMHGDKHGNQRALWRGTEARASNPTSDGPYDPVLLYESQRALHRYRREADTEDTGSGIENPCENGTTLCMSNQGEMCVFTSEDPNYECQCQEDYEGSPGSCVEVPEEKRLYLTTTLGLQFVVDYNNHSSTGYMDFTEAAATALSSAFSGLAGQKAVLVEDLRQANGSTEVVYVILFTTNVSDVMTNSVAERVLQMENLGSVDIDNETVALDGLTAIFSSLALITTDSDAVDWCSSSTLFNCTQKANSVCMDGGVNPRYSCECATGYEEVLGECVDLNVVQYDLYPYGPEAGDNQMDNSDDGIVTVPVGIGFPVNTQGTYQIHIGVNGLISFTAPKTGLSFSLDRDNAMLCPYLTDIDTSSQGDVYYHYYPNRTAETAGIFEKADKEVREFAEENNYVSKLIIVVTWVNVAHRESSNPQTEQATFQVALISDGTQSFGLVYYKTGAMNWVYRPETALIVGQSMGDGSTPEQEIVSNTSTAFTQMDTYSGNTGRRGMWMYTIGNAYIPNQDCWYWYINNLANLSDVTAMAEQLPDCPCNTAALQTSQWRQYRQTGNVTCYRLNRRSSIDFQPYSKDCCYRSVNQTSTEAWVSDPPSAGGLLAYNPAFKTYRPQYRQERDIHEICCNQSDTDFCSLYYQLRPVGICNSTSQFGFSATVGDPHVRTLDSKDYTFNGWGEYTMVNLTSPTINFIVQGRTERAWTDDGTPINATVFTAFAASDGTFDATVALDSNRTYLEIVADGVDYSNAFRDNTLSDDQDAVQRRGDSLQLTFDLSISLTITVGYRLLDIEVSLPKSLQGQPKGLLGNFNDDPDDDFTLANSSVLPASMTDRQIFERFGLTWAILPEDSVFRYDPGKGPEDYRNPGFVPLFLDEISEEEKNASIQVCGNFSKVACVYDFIATRSKTLASQTRISKDNADETDAILKNRAPVVRTNTSITVSKGDTVTLMLEGSDEDGDDITFYVAGSAGGVTLIQSEATYTAGEEDKSFNLGFYALDPKNAASQVVTVQVVYCPSCSHPNGTCDPDRVRPSLSSQSFRYAACRCETGYAGDYCQDDLDGCADDPCISGQTCTDIPAEEQKRTNRAFNCSSCPPGYVADDVTSKCRDEDECSTRNNECRHNCSNVEGSYRCYCMSGYRLAGDGFLCDDINECADKTSQCEQVCVNFDGGFNCTCVEGYTLDGDTCQQDQTAQATCQSLNCSQACRLNNNTAECFCQAGYTVNTTNSSACDDEDECSTFSPCTQICENTEGSFRCGCHSGYSLDEDGVTCSPCTGLTYGPGCSMVCDCNGRSRSCHPVSGCQCESGWRGEHCETDVPECDENPGICSKAFETCVNTYGSYRCDCVDGYARNTDSGLCEDVDECEDGLDTCGPLERCDNTPGSYYCTCQQGYRRQTDSTCTDVDECEDGIDSCQQLCSNNPGSYLCDCRPGYKLAFDRISCDTAEEVCQASNLTCQHFCTLDGSGQPYCFCETGYRLNEEDGACIDIDECFESTANCGGDCENLPGGFQCTCPVGTRLGNDQRSCLECGQGTYGEECSQTCNCGVGSNACDPRTGCNCSSGWTGAQCDQDIDECATTSATSECSAQSAICTNFPGGYRCDCSTGYEKPPNSTVCADVDECASSPCGQRCENNPGSYRCSCNAGFTLSNNSIDCLDINECLLNSTNQCTQTCVNTEGSYRCSCGERFVLNNDGITCTARTTCSNTIVCPSTNGGCFYDQTGNDTCYCDKGYNLVNGSSCSLEVRDWCGEANCDGGCTVLNERPYFQCNCSVGFQLNEDGQTCRECPADRYGVNCSSQCTCDVDNTRECDKGSGICRCKDGWEGDNCTQDIDECANSTRFSCVQNSTCEDIDGGYLCQCVPGFFKGADGNCSACDDWFYGDCSTSCPCNKLNTLTCDKESGACSCKSGWNGTDCNDDINECETDQHNCTGNHEKCDNTDGGYNCVCEAGCRFNESGHCVDRDECFDESHNCSQQCSNYVGGFNCSCLPGYHGDVYNCQDINECNSANGGCADQCTNTNGSFSCSCNNGYTLATDGLGCDDIDECNSTNGGCADQCTNINGSFNCSCNDGYTLATDGLGCDDINECNGTDNGGCVQQCNNTDGSYFCSCNSTYTLAADSRGCDDFNECNDSNGGCADQCTNTNGSYICSCNDGYKLASDGLGCDELLTYQFGLRIGINFQNLSSILESTSSTEYMDLEESIRQQLFVVFSNQLGNGTEVVITSLTAGSINVEGEVRAKVTEGTTREAVTGAAAKAMADLAKQLFTIFNQTATVSNVTLRGREVSDGCSALAIISPCTNGFVCTVDNSGTPFCQLDEEDSALIIGLAVGIPLCVVVVIVIIVLIVIHVRSRRQKKRMSENDYDDNGSFVSNLFARNIATRGDWRAGGGSTCDTVSSISSDEQKQLNRMARSRESEFDSSPWKTPRPGAAAGSDNGAFSFSWDFMYNQLQSSDQPFTIKRPQVATPSSPPYRPGRGDSTT